MLIGLLDCLRSLCNELAICRLGDLSGCFRSFGSLATSLQLCVLVAQDNGFLAVRWTVEIVFTAACRKRRHWVPHRGVLVLTTILLRGRKEGKNCLQVKEG